jgi:hypothetical protein
MKKLFLLLTITLLALAPAVAQTQQGGEAARPARQRLIGEVTAVDATAKQLTVRADTGETATLTTNEQTTYLRMPPGETSLQKGQPAAFADVHVGDRVLAPGITAAGGAARQIILMARAATAAGGPGRDDGRRLNGRVVSADASKKLIVVQTRGREGVEAVTVDASSAARILRYAPDSQRAADAQPGSFADVRAGDSLRATGERSADGKTFKAEEVLSGAFARFVGVIKNVDAARGELTVTNDLAGQGAVTLTFGSRSTLRRATPEFEKAVAERAERFGRREQRRASGQGGGGGGQAQGEGGAPREGRRDGERRRDGEQRGGDGERRGEGGQRRGGGPGGPGGGGNNIQQMVEGLPAVTLADLKKGDAVVVTVTPGADPARATVVSLLTGSAEVLRGMQQFQRGPEGQRGMSPGLPGDVIGGGQGPTREPPR